MKLVGIRNRHFLEGMSSGSREGVCVCHPVSRDYRLLAHMMVLSRETLWVQTSRLSGGDAGSSSAYSQPSPCEKVTAGIGLMSHFKADESRLARATGQQGGHDADPGSSLPLGPLSPARSEPSVHTEPRVSPENCQVWPKNLKKIKRLQTPG